MMAICSALGGFIYSYNHHLPFILCGLFSFAASALSFFFVEPKHDTEKFSFKNYFKPNYKYIKFNNGHTATVFKDTIVMEGMVFSIKDIIEIRNAYEELNS
jgi:hypothetical protein